MSKPKAPLPRVTEQPGRAHVAKIAGLQLGPTPPKPGSMLKQPKAPKTR
jgi:hypothetical protein